MPQGGIIYTHKELKTWVKEHKAGLIGSGRWYDEDAYKECYQILKTTQSIGVIIPVGEGIPYASIERGRTIMACSTNERIPYSSIAPYFMGFMC